MRDNLAAKCRVVRPHNATYLTPMRAAAGECLKIGKRDTEYPGWIWCISSDGSAAWVPEASLRINGESGLLVADYDSTELNVGAGEEVTILLEESGWLWCRNAGGQEGWVPRTCITS